MRDPSAYGLLDLFGAIQAGETDTVKLLEGCARLFAADGASLFLWRPESRGFVLAAAQGDGRRIPEGARIEQGAGVAGQAMDAGRVSLLNEPHPQIAELSSALVVPLAVRGRAAVGALNLSRRANSQPYAQHEVELAEAVATTLAFLFENALLVRRLEEGRAQLQAILSGLKIDTLLFDQGGHLQALSHEDAKHLLEDTATDAAVQRLRAEAAVTGEVARFLLQREPEPGLLTAKDLAVVPLPDGGFAVTAEDVSREVSLQRSLEDARRLAELGQMTATLAHEIRNPLTSLRAVGQVLAETESAEFGKMIEEEVDKLCELCDQFLDLARPVGLTFEPTDLGQLLARLVRAHQPDAVAAGVSLALLQAANGVGHRLPDLDPRRIEQAARNLILNALQATPSGGSVSVILEPLGFSVEDTGPGIPPELRDRLFTPFFTTKTRGTGLGLCTVRKIVEAHHGAIAYETSPKGTRFTVRLPDPR